MLVCNTLRVDPGDGSPVADYRIENGWVETRTPGEESWQRLTPRQLTVHVMSHTVVAYWLRCKMGVHPLIRACNQDHDEPSCLGPSDRVAA